MSTVLVKAISMLQDHADLHEAHPCIIFTKALTCDRKQKP
jgi:hypothetical protein